MEPHYAIEHVPTSLVSHWVVTFVNCG